MGEFRYVGIVWNAGGINITGDIKYYITSNSLIFSHTWPVPVSGASVGNKDIVSSSFPSLQLGPFFKDEIGFLSYGSNMMGWDHQSSGR